MSDSASSAPASPAEVRARIDVIDSELVRLRAQRQGLVRAAASFKSDDRAVRASDRVEQVIASVRERARDAGLEPSVAEAVWRAMIGAFIEVELAEHAQVGHAQVGHAQVGRAGLQVQPGQ
ncbi:chorismate mutase [Saccharothrix sp. ALI-22-I]|uniref:chorismate mutase n=1 Tax=Saccharothrix sp. ALI-22-I TaxID=1933778 RepID=UPI00097C3E41|nr:chorismate mutase [Saccharothrix sp. ALI-22-I]ONI89207.1 chorismate mutase [Saccharothrix sp. ALI-22-I]